MPMASTDIDGRRDASVKGARTERLFIPGLGRLYEKLSPFSYDLMRFALGAILVPHGVNKLFFGDVVNASRTMEKLGLAPPSTWAWFIGVLEFAGGLMLALGLYTRLVALAVFVEMLVISFGVLWPKWWWGGRGMQYAALMAVLALAIFFRGGGDYSLDRRLARTF
jgi:putative oxidoreductase